MNALRHIPQALRRPAALSALTIAGCALLTVSCKSTSGTAQNPYENNPYYGPSGAGSDYVDVAPVPPTNDYAYDSGYVAPASAPATNTNTYTPPATNTYTAPAPASGGGGMNYTVVKGDTLYSLARRYNTSVAAIQSANGINGELIRIGQTLTIPQA